MAQPVGPIVVGHTPEDLLNDIIEGANSELLVRKIQFPLQAIQLSTGNLNQDDRNTESEANVDTEGDNSAPSPNDPERDDEEEPVIVSLSHVLTNIVILQEFILELAAVMQVRASLFGEVKFVES